MEIVNLILDLDGVLITTPPWKPDEIMEDNYSKFNEECVKNLNSLLSLFPTSIWLSSTRRLNKTLEEFNQIFQTRKIKNSIEGFLPNNADLKTRKQEVESFIKQNNLKNYLIIDDDKSLNELDSKIKKQLVQTTFLQGFNKEKLEESIKKLNTTQG
tara:strand:- start:19 stop:486 length:468 start_codon:yes stop_codon:yes gene_type:complete